VLPPLDPADIRWDRYPAVGQEPLARRWLGTQVLLGLASNTIDAYARAVQDFLAYCQGNDICAAQVTHDEIARYIGDLRQRPNPRGSNVLHLDSGVGLANATLQQRLTAIRLFFDHLVEDGTRETNPVGRGRYTPGKAFGGKRDRGLLPRFKKLPWIPNGEQWQAFLQAAKPETSQQYIHLSGRDLAQKPAQGMAHIHARRIQIMAGAFPKPEVPE